MNREPPTIVWAIIRDAVVYHECFEDEALAREEQGRYEYEKPQVTKYVIEGMCPALDREFPSWTRAELERFAAQMIAERELWRESKEATELRAERDALLADRERLINELGFMVEQSNAIQAASTKLSRAGTHIVIHLSQKPDVV